MARAKSLDALGSLGAGGLQGLLGGLGGRGGGQPKGNGLSVVPADQWDPSNLGQVPDTDQVTGPALEGIGRAYAGVQRARNVAGRQSMLEQLPTTSAKIDQVRANQVEDAFAHDDPTWTPFLGAEGAAADRAGAEGKSFKLGAFGDPGFRVQGPAGQDMSFSNAQFEDSPLDPRSGTGFATGSMANRSGLSTQALRTLAAGMRG